MHNPYSRQEFTSSRETFEDMLNEYSSLPSVFTDPGVYSSARDDAGNFTGNGEANVYDDEFNERRSLQNVDDLQSESRKGELSGRRRNKRRRTGTEVRVRAQSARRAEKKKRHRIHSDTDLRKMRPIIASPFMPTLATQVSVNAAAGLPSTSSDRRKTAQSNSAIVFGTEADLPGAAFSQNVSSKAITNNVSNNTNMLAAGVTVSTTTSNNMSDTGGGKLISAAAIPPKLSGGLMKVVGQSKYGALPLKKASVTIAVKPDRVSALDDGVTPDAGDGESSSDSDEDEDESSSSSSSLSSSDSSVYTRFSDLTKKQWATVGMLAVANLCSTVAFSCIAPFYPAEAQNKGMSPSDTGIVFGIFELVMFFSAPILGKYMAFFGSKRMFTVGLLVTGVTAIAFGFLNFLPSNRTFFWASLTIRCAEALGDACFVTSSFAISAKCFPGRIATIVGIMETFAGLGYTAGPVIGGVLYEYGGFQVPFLVLGCLLIVATILSYFLIEEIDDEPTEDAMGMLSMLKIPVIWLMVFAVVICAISLSFLDPTLADHLSSFQLSMTMVGLMFLLCGGVYTVTAPLWGMLLDRWDCSNSLMLFGSSVTVVSMLFVGPSPFLGMEKNLVVIGIALALLGLAAGALYIPTFQNCLDAVKENGYDDSFQTYGCVSGVFQSAFAFGAFIGPTLGGVSVQQLGFGWTTTIIGFINLGFILALLFLFFSKRYMKRYRALDANDSSALSPTKKCDSGDVLA